MDVREVNKFGREVKRSGSYYYYSSTNFTAEDSPLELNIVNDLGCEAGDGYIIVDGEGDLIVELMSLSDNDYGPKITIKKNEIHHLYPQMIKSIKLTHSGTNTAYRIFVC